MRHLKVNLLSGDRHLSAADGTGRKPVGFFLSSVLVILAFVGSFGFGRLTRSETAAFALEQFNGIPILGQMRHLISSPDRKLAGEADDRINILLLGMGGEGHEGPNLTDTIMVASIKPSTKQVALLSIPRDLLVPLPKHGWRKINSVNAFGELDTPGRGGDYSRTMLEGLLGIDIPYYVRVDFDGFKEVVDAAGGVDIHVDRAFSDATYPTNDYKVMTVSYAKGWQTMDGETALRYARSRHGSNGEGGDFSRAKRQQKVLNALKDKMLSAKTYRSPAAIANTLAALKSNITTNMQIGEIVRLARMAQDGQSFAISHKVIDNSPTSPLTNGSYGGAYVLVPKNDDWSGLRTIATNLFQEAAPEAVVTTPKPAPVAAEDKARIEIMNGNGKSGQARTVATALAAAGFEVVKIGNADSFAYDDTVIYDLTKGRKSSALAKLKRTMADAETSSKLPKAIDATQLKADFLVILGGEGAASSGT